jgi:glycerophosphoryl diester phosphodiesterase
MRHALQTLTMALWLAACGQRDTSAAIEAGVPSSPPAPELTESGRLAAPGAAPLAQRLDCLRETGGILLIGHRGGPTRDYPENAIETFQRTFDAGVHAMEIDIAETKDGHLVLMHDEELDRTTTGTGLVSASTLAEIQNLKLKTYAATTDFVPPTLAAALDWVVKSDAIVELDKKKSASWAPIIAAVRKAKAENNVLLITYTDEQAGQVHTLAPDLVITATVETLDHLDSLIARGVNTGRLVAWTGAVAPRPELWRALAERAVESAFGTLGPRATSLDTKYWQDGDGSEFSKLAADGLPILVTDMTDKVARQLAGLRQISAACGL